MKRNYFLPVYLLIVSAWHAVFPARFLMSQRSTRCRPRLYPSRRLLRLQSIRRLFLPHLPSVELSGMICAPCRHLEGCHPHCLPVVFPPVIPPRQTAFENPVAPPNDSILIPGGWTHPSKGASRAQTIVQFSAGTAYQVDFGWDFQFLP